MANSKWQYVRDFEQVDTCLPNTWIVVRVDGSKFADFTASHGFAKPNDERGLRLMNDAAEQVMEYFKDVRIAFGQSDEFSFVFARTATIYGRRAAKILTMVVSQFTASYTFLWSKHFADTPLQQPPTFDGRIVLYPSQDNVKDYLKWRQADCHINNLYNTVFWALVLKGHLTPAEAEAKLRGSNSGVKNEILFSDFNLNYNKEPEIFRKGSILFRRSPDERQITVEHCSLIADEFWDRHRDLL